MKIKLNESELSVLLELLRCDYYLADNEESIRDLLVDKLTIYNNELIAEHNMPEHINLNELLSSITPTFLEDLVLNKEDTSNITKLVLAENYDIRNVKVAVYLNDIEIRIETIEVLFSDWLDRLHSSDIDRLKLLEKEYELNRIIDERVSNEVEEKISQIRDFIDHLEY